MTNVNSKMLSLLHLSFITYKPTESVVIQLFLFERFFLTFWTLGSSQKHPVQ